MSTLKSLPFFLLVPGLFIGVLPYWIVQSDAPLCDPGPLRYLAIPLWIIGFVTMAWCFLDFTVKGRGTPAPFDPPEKLVATGPYRYVRNPMYVAGIIALFGWILWSPSVPRRIKSAITEESVIDHSMLEQLKGRARALKREAYAIYIAARDPRTPWYVKALIFFVVAHTFSPIDLIPDFIPVLGYLDDLIITPGGIWLAVRLIPSKVMQEARETAAVQGVERSVSRFGAAIVVFVWIVILIGVVSLISSIRE